MSLMELVEACRWAKTVEARMELITAILGRVGGTVRSVVFGHAPPLGAQDIYMQVLAAVAADLHKFRGQTEGELYGWCAQIAHNKVNGHWRKEMRLKMVSLDAEDLELWFESLAVAESESMARITEAREILERLAQLDPKCFTYLYMRHVEKLTLPEIGEMEGLAEDTIRMRIKRCRLRLMDAASRL